MTAVTTEAVFSDWLSVTMPPYAPAGWVPDFLRDIGFVQTSDTHHELGRGTAKFRATESFQALSFSGRALVELRAIGALPELAQRLTDQPHTVTRLDASLDLAKDAAPVVRGLWRRYRTTGVRLGRKVVRAAVSLATRECDGQETGTFYAGNRRTCALSAIVYDKQAEALQRRSEALPPTTRYELRVRTKQATVGDFMQPEALFWHYMSPALLVAPAGVPGWEAGNPFAWSAESPASVDALTQLRRRVDRSADLESLVQSADQLSDGRRLLLALIQRRLGFCPDGCV